jgi:outer membrane protein assembly factor BamB
MRALGMFVLGVSLGLLGMAQEPLPRLYTQPQLPPAEVLDRLGLTLAWAVRLPTQGTEDGLSHLQLLPAGKEVELLVQTRIGLVLLLDAETGALKWRRQLGKAYEHQVPAAFTDDSLFLVRREILYILDRKTGNHRLYTVDPQEKRVRYGFQLLGVPTAAPATDGERLYLAFEHRLGAYILPRFPALAKEADSLPETSSPQPDWAWGAHTEGYPAGVPVVFPPVLIGEFLNALGADGTLINLFAAQAVERYRYKLFSPVAAPMGVHGGVLYLASEDHHVYALEAGPRRLHWRIAVGAPVRQQPLVTDRDVFIGTEERGLFRLERRSGERLWRNPRATSYLSTNEKFLYARDRRGWLLVLDYARGTTLTDYDLSDYTVACPNELTDRFYLGAHDGTLLCLHARGEKTPHRLRALPGPPAPKGGTPVPPEKKGAPAAPEKKEAQ